MKSPIKIVIAAAVAAVNCLSLTNASAQTVLAGWDVSGLTASGPSPWAPTAGNPNLIVGGLTKGAGVTNTATANVWGGNSWTNFGVPPSETQAIGGNKYVTFTITPDPGYTVSITNISKFYVTKSGTGPASGELQYSTNGTTFNDIAPLSYGVQGTAITAVSIGTFDLLGIAALQNLNSNLTATFRIVNWGATSFPGTWYIGNGNSSGSDFEVLGAVVSAGNPPHIAGISPPSVTANAGQTVQFTVLATGDAASNFWYKITGTTTNLISSATAATLTLPGVLGGDTASYFALLTNAYGAATSSVVALTVNDPIIAAQPANTYGLLGGTVRFIVSAIGTAPDYQWYFSDTSGNILAPVTDGNSTVSGVAVVSGSGTSTLTITNLQSGDPANFVVVVTNVYGAVTSSVASLLAVNTTASLLAFWDFNGDEFTNLSINPNCVYDPVPYVGAGAASAVGTCYNPGDIFSASFSPFAGAVDPNDGLGFTSHLPPFSWGTSHYPLTGGNKQNGVQFNVSTVGAKNILVSYQSRVSGTASDYERLQYTTNGTDWIDYPASSTFGGVGTTYLPYNYDLSGFPGAANNPNFGIRVVTEFESTASYGVGTTNGYVGTANSYSSGGANGFSAGTVTYDLVTFTGDAITNNNAPPVVSGFMDTNMVDYLPLTIGFTAGDDSTPADSLQYSAVSLNTSTFHPTFNFGGSGANRTLTINPNSIAQTVAAAPILVTATDANGDSTASWFLVTVGTVNLPPTNSLTKLSATNTLGNSTLVLPFSVGDDRTAVGGLTYSVSSANTTLIPDDPVNNIIVGNAGTANPTLTIIPAANQLGVGVVTVTVSDNDSQAPKSTTASIAILVRPNTNIVAIDYFNYDQSGSLDAVSSGFWQHLSGNFGQMKVGSGVVTVDTFDNTENLQTPLLGAPYKANSGAVLYSSFVVNMNDPFRQPVNNGTYFSAFNDGSGNTANVEDCLVVATNDAAPGCYRLGIANLVGGTALTAQMFPQDLVPGTNYTVVTALSLTNGFSTVWVNPGSQSSPSITDTSVHSGTNVFAISDFELRESGGSGGSASMSCLKVGITFDSVFPSLSVQPAGTNVILNWSDPTLGIQSATNVTGPYTDVLPAAPPYTNNAGTNRLMFFRFKR